MDNRERDAHQCCGENIGAGGGGGSVRWKDSILGKCPPRAHLSLLRPRGNHTEPNRFTNEILLLLSIPLYPITFRSSYQIEMRMRAVTAISVSAVCPSGLRQE